MSACLRWGLAGLLSVLGIGSASADVSLSLRIPESETWVLGDTIPLYWRFENGSSRPMGFMWEGCCRLNGKLEIWQMDLAEALETSPPGQALAHMFAKADRLEPGVGKEYETRLSDWVGLPGTGRYRLRGTYRGVLPTQVPQVPKGLDLWRDAASSGTVEVSVLSVADYLAQRETRTRTSGVRVTVSGPRKISPSEPTSWTVTFDNQGPSARAWSWPDRVALWVVNATGHRVAPAAVISGTSETGVLEAGQVRSARFSISPDRWEGVALGAYSVFVERESGAPGEPRVPSNVLSVDWKLGPDEVRRLVQDAARGSGTGARNASLKMLRVYLGDVGPVLANLDRSGWDENALRLADRLVLASRLRSLLPHPGKVEIPVAVDVRGECTWAQPILVKATAGMGGGVTGQMQEVLAVRRHLGWEPQLVLVPAEETLLGTLIQTGGKLATDPSEWSGLPEALVPIGPTNGLVRLTLRDATVGEIAAGSESLREGEDLREDPKGARFLAKSSVPWKRLRQAVESVCRPGDRREVVVVHGR